MSAAATQKATRESARSALFSILSDSLAGAADALPEQAAGRGAAISAKTLLIRTAAKGQVVATRLAAKPRFVSFVNLDNVQADRIIKRGIPSRALLPLGEYLGLGKGVVADFLDLDRTTALRKINRDEPLPRHASEAVLRLLELTQMAEDVFSTQDDACAWLRRAHPMLDGETPLECAKTAFGAVRVKEMLVALKYGGVV